jgi:CO dehydrogenase maturation factor
MNTTKIFAFLGKGGVGKTILSALTGKFFLEQGKKVLFIDADPAMGLAIALKVEGQKTIGQAREEIIKQAKIVNSTEEKERLADIIDYLLFSALLETPSFSMLIMGQTNTLGCFCPVNALLKGTISAIASQYEVIIIDAEAGIEQINRQVINTVNYPIIITDHSVRGLKTVISLKKIIDQIKDIQPEKIGTIFNRVESVEDRHLAEIKSHGIHCYGLIRPDPYITEFDAQGKSLLEFPMNASAYEQLTQIIRQEKFS